MRNINTQTGNYTRFQFILILIKSNQNGLLGDISTLDMSQLLNFQKKLFVKPKLPIDSE